jgi:hypothetical protein
MAIARDVFNRPTGIRTRRAEAGAVPAALQSPPPVTPAPVQQAAPVQYQQPAQQCSSRSPRPRGPCGSSPRPSAAQPVGGPQGPQWDPNAQPAAQPVAAGANGAAAAGPLW